MHADAGKVCKSIKAHCPHCNKPLDLSDFAVEFFRRVLLHLKDHDRFVIPHFGTFKMYIWQPREGVFKGKSYSVPSQRYLHFRAAPYVKNLLKKIR